HGNHAQLVVGLDLLQDLQSVHLGQLQIEQEHGRVVGGAAGETPAAVQIVERLGAVPRDDDLVGEVVVGQRRQRQLHVVGIVLHHENSPELAHAFGSCFGIEK